MGLRRLPETLLRGQYLHCRPSVGGPVIEARIVPGGEDALVRVFIVCSERLPCSNCRVRVREGDHSRRCHYWRGDGLGHYRIVGPGMDQKRELRRT
jgi:hypothetical protein